MDSNSEIQGYNVYPMLHFHRKFSSGIIADLREKARRVWESILQILRIVP